MCVEGRKEDLLCCGPAILERSVHCIVALLLFVCFLDVTHHSSARRSPNVCILVDVNAILERWPSATLAVKKGLGGNDYLPSTHSLCLALRSSQG